MKKVLVFALFLGVVFPLSATADDSLVSFEGGIGVIPVSNVVGMADTGDATRNTVRGISPGGQPWMIAGLGADVGLDGRISVDGRGLLLAGSNAIGTNGGQSVRAVLFCGTLAHSSSLVALEPNGDFRIDDLLTPTPPDPCATPILLIVSGTGRWFAAGIPKH